MPPTCLQKTKRERTAINIDIKKEICKYMLANTDIKHADVALFFNTKYKLDIDRSTITKIWQSPVSAGLSLTDAILQQKGLELAQMLNISENQLKFTNGWVYRFKKRNGLQKIRFLEEATAYNEEDIYNANETGLFFEWNLIKHLAQVQLQVFFDETEDDFNNKENNEEEIVAESFYSAQNRKKPMDARIIHSFKSKYKKEYYNDDVNFDLQNFKPDSDITEIKDLFDNLPETDNVRNYFQILDHEIPAEENLIEEQIVNLVQLENKEESEDDDDLDNEIPSISIKEAVYSGLETFIPEFDVNNLRIFQKYLKVSKVQEFNSKKQSTLDMFFKS
ncbi:tigger transposable element-derived protein 5 [Rhizophagus irregularis DAOM 181602=DAOM 197198]|nr:tigger transposable element-derived protein 5 [Rhizophagus irregularis DAOM 181602=DAOM 197198]